MKHPKTFIFVMLSPLLAAWIIGMELEAPEIVVAFMLGLAAAMFVDEYA